MKSKKKLESLKKHNSKNSKFIFVDLDGSLLNNNGEISNNTLKYLLDLKNSGHKIFINTGRSFKDSINFYKQLKLDTILINNNGAHISNPNDNNFAEIIITFNISPVLNFLKVHNLYPKINFILLETIAGPYYWKNENTTKNNQWLYEHHLSKKNLAENRIFNIFETKSMLKNVLTMLISFNKKDLPFLLPLLKSNIDNIKFLNWSKKSCALIEVNNATINKGIAINYIVKLYKLRKENIFAFGDNCNDLEMLDYANNSFLMKNAPEQFLKNTNFNVTIDTNNNDGIIKTLKKHIKI